MDPALAVLIIVLILFFLIAIGVPIAIALGVAGGLGIVIIQGWDTLLYTFATFPVGRIASYAWIAIPLFILLGNLAASSGVATNAYVLTNKWVGKLKGGLVLATIAACGLIAATTGSGSTATAVMGKIAVPEMIKYGYNKELALGVTTCCGPLGILIPPSGSFVIIGIMAELSIGKLFISGILPGLLTIVLFMIMVNIRCRLNPQLAPVGSSYSWKERFKSLPLAWGVVVIFVVIIGGLYTGIATANEVGAIGCFVAFIMAIIAIFQRQSTWKAIIVAFQDTVSVSAMIFAFVIGSGIFSLFLTLSGTIPEFLNYINTFNVPSWVLVVVICFIYLILGMFFDPLSMTLLTVPIFFPIMGGVGVDLIWFAVVTVIMIETAAMTPPVAMNAFIMRAVYPDSTLVEIWRGSGWFIVMNLLVIVVLFIFPQIAIWLPGKL